MDISAEGVLARYICRHSPLIIGRLRHIKSIHRFITIRNAVLIVAQDGVADNHVLVGCVRMALLVVFSAAGFLSAVVLVLKSYILLIPAGRIYSGHDAGIEGFVALHDGIYLLHGRTATDGQDHLLVAARAFHFCRRTLGIGNKNNIRTRRVPISGTKSRTVQPLQTYTITRFVSFFRRSHSLRAHDR